MFTKVTAHVKQLSRRDKWILAVSVCLNAVLFVAFLFVFEDNYKVARLQKKYPHVAYSSLGDSPNDLLINFKDLRSELKDEVTPYGDSFYFYFEYLPTGASIGFNEKTEFVSASLIKIPIAMAYLRQREVENKTDDPIVEIEQKDINKEFGSLWKEGVGYQLPLSQALQMSIEESDNTAAAIVLHHTKPSYLSDVYDGLDIPFIIDKSQSVVNAKNYSSLLRSLFFSSFLTKEDSENVLVMMTQTEFKDKLVAGVDLKVEVAHKIGVFGDLYMDCGIIYLPRRPYTLCMASKSDERTAQAHMKKVSATVYKYMSTVKYTAPE